MADLTINHLNGPNYCSVPSPEMIHPSLPVGTKSQTFSIRLQQAVEGRNRDKLSACPWLGCIRWVVEGCY